LQQHQSSLSIEPAIAVRATAPRQRQTHGILHNARDGVPVFNRTRLTLYFPDLLLMNSFNGRKVQSQYIATATMATSFHVHSIPHYNDSSKKYQLFKFINVIIWSSDDQRGRREQPQRQLILRAEQGTSRFAQRFVLRYSLPAFRQMIVTSPNAG
jgi:hypothetical protein